MVRMAMASSKYVVRGSSDEDEEDNGAASDTSSPMDLNSGSDYEATEKKRKSTAKKRTPAKKSPKRMTPRTKISPKKTPASKRSPRKTYNEDSESDDEPDDEPDDDEEDDYAKYIPIKKRGRPPAKTRPRAKPKTPPKATPSSTAGRGRGRPRKPKTYYEGSEESERESEDEESSYDELPVTKKHRSKGSYRRSQPKEVKPKFPPVSEMVVESIKAMRDNPRKGSTLGSIKETILLNWKVDMNRYDKKIKKFILNAVETGEIVRVKGTGFRGRFTVPGLKVRKRKRKATSLKSSKRFDEDEVEYVPAKTKRAEEKERSMEELMERRKELKIKEEKKAEERATRPVMKRAPKKTEYEVEAIRGMRVKENDGVEETEYLVKFAGYTKLYWENEANVGGCQDLITAYRARKEAKDKEMAEARRLAEEEGAYEVAKILSVRKLKGKNEFLVRWKGYGADDDTWEPEDNLECRDLIERFMREWDSLPERSLREDPKKVERLEFASSRRERNNRGGFRVSYVGMDE